jgi:6-phospho-3-hexuloisomerase
MARKLLDSAVDYVLEEARALVRKTDDKEVEKLLKALSDAQRVFLYGAGRSGLVARAFAIRLLHLGYQTYVIGETISAPVQRKDLMLLISGTGETYPVAMSAEIAKNIGATVASITANPHSKVASFSDIVVDVPVGVGNGRRKTHAPLGTLFETTTWIFLDGVVAELMKRRNQSEEMMRQRHATME